MQRSNELRAARTLPVRGVWTKQLSEATGCGGGRAPGEEIRGGETLGEDKKGDPRFRVFLPILKISLLTFWVGKEMTIRGKPFLLSLLISGRWTLPSAGIFEAPACR